MKKLLIKRFYGFTTMEKKIIVLFDVDQTLTPARMDIQQSMVDCLDAVRAKGIHLGIVSGSDINKVTE